MLFLGVAFFACRSPERKADAEPPPPAPTVAHCAARSDLGLPLESVGFCLDADSDVRTYGARTRAPLEGVCTELFNGECELYRRFGLNRVESFSYVERENVGRRITVVRSDFDASLGAYGFFQRRVVGDDHPLRVATKLVDVGARGALGAGVLYVWSGASVLELIFTSDEEPPQVIERIAGAPLVALATGLVHAGRPATPSPRLLELVEGCRSARGPRTDGPRAEADCAGSQPVPFGVRVEEGLLFGRVRTTRFLTSVLESPSGGTFREIVVEQRDARAARDLLSEILRQPLGERWDPTKTRKLRVTREDAEPEDWTLAVAGRYLVAVGPDPTSPRPLPAAALDGEIVKAAAKLTRSGE